jgi:exodeoxyribonuclease VII large subunit
MIRRKLNGEIRDFLQAGVKVKLRGSIKFHDVYGLSFQIDDIDQDFTIGELERKKLAAIERLTKEGILDLNKELELPPVVQRIAVISSRTAAGLADFINQLHHNQHDIPFSIDIYHATVQGVNAVDEIIHALGEISEYSEYYDAICLLRGGGSKLDLSAFDDESLCRVIGNLAIPLLSAIGHETDTSVVDLTAHTYLKTPTALAAFLIDRNAGFLSFLYDQYQRALTSAQRQLQVLKNDLYAILHRAELSASNAVQLEKQLLQRISQKAEYAAGNKLLHIKQELRVLKTRSLSADPSLVLARGYALVSQNQHIAKSASDVQAEGEITILFHDGKIKTNMK